jgi:O-antigen/teichoic acid export membrane protein
VRRVLTTTAIYALAAAAQRGLAFLLLPIYTRHLTIEQYGALELLGSMSAVLYALLLLGLPGALTKCFHRDCESADERRRVWWTVTAIQLPLALLGTVVVALLAPSIGGWLGLDDAGGLVRLVAANSVGTCLVAIVLASFRAEERASAFAIVSFLQFALAAVLNVTLLVPLGWGLEGVLTGNLASNLLVLPVAYRLARQRSTLRLERRLVRPLLAFGVLTLPSTIAAWVMDLSDRWVLRLYDSLEDVAVYGVGYKIALVLQILLVWPFQLSWPNVAFSIQDDATRRRVFGSTLTYLTLTLAAASVALSSVSAWVVPWLAGGAYREAYRVVPLVTLGYLFNGAFYAVSPALHVAERTRYFPPLTLAAAGLNLLLNFLLIPPLGMLGAAIATAASFAQLALTTAWIGGRALDIRWPWLRLLKILLSTAVALGVVYAVGARAGGSAGAVAVGLLAPMACFLALLGLLRVIDASELRALRLSLSRILSRRRST